MVTMKVSIRYIEVFGCMLVLDLMDQDTFTKDGCMWQLEKGLHGEEYTAEGRIFIARAHAADIASTVMSVVPFGSYPGVRNLHTVKGIFGDSSACIPCL